MHIFDDNAFELLCQVEGESWRRQQWANSQSPYGFFAWLTAWNEKARMLTAHPEYSDEPVGSFLDTPGDGAIYGDGGWARYAVRPDGEVVLLKWSATPAKQGIATEYGVRVS